MNKTHYLLFILLAFLAGLAGAYVAPASHGPETAASVKETVYARVMRTGTFRCGYSPWPPLIIKDPNTGKLSGIVYDYLEALGDALHLKIDWAEETGWGDFPAALQSGRIDGFCAGVWPNASRAREIDFTRPILYQPIYAYARADDHRFDNNLAALDSPSITLATADGETSSHIANGDFPKAKQVQLAQMSNGSELFTIVVTGKADVTFTDLATAAEYDAKNPGKLRRIESKVPVRVFGNTIAIARGQDGLRRMLDTTTEELLASGVIDKITAQYEQYPGTLLRVAPPYQPESAPASSPRQ